MEKNKKAGINTKLLVLIIILLIVLGAAIYALSFYGDISDPESLFEEPIPTPVSYTHLTLPTTTRV